MELKKRIIKYYDYCQPYYNFFWYNNNNLAMHYGFWNDNTKKHSDALVNMNRFLAKKIKVKSGDIILDAGCGIGGSSIWLAKNFGVKVIGITLSKKQVNLARKFAKENKVEHLVKFYVRDYLHTRFDDASFDIVWGIESVCHAKNKKDFVSEAYRILKKNGKLIVADGFIKKEPNTEDAKRLLKDFYIGLALPNTAKIEEFRKYLKELKFKNIGFLDKTKNIIPSSVRLYHRCTIALPLIKILERFKITSKILTLNIIAGINQYKLIKKGIGIYGIFYAEK